MKTTCSTSVKVFSLAIILMASSVLMAQTTPVSKAKKKPVKVKTTKIIVPQTPTVVIPNVVVVPAVPPVVIPNVVVVPAVPPVVIPNVVVVPAVPPVEIIETLDPNFQGQRPEKRGRQNTTTTTTTISTTTTTTTSGGHRGSGYNNNGQAEVYEQPAPAFTDNAGRSGGANVCRFPMTGTDFEDALNSVKKQTFADSQMKVAKQITKANCLSSAQVKALIGTFSFENDKLDYAKFAFDYTIDKNNYYKINDAFGYSNSVDELNSYLEGKQ